MKSLALSLALSAVSALHSMEFEYMQYLAKFGKTMNSKDEFEARLQNFTAIDQEIKKINAENNSWVAGHNQFSDWTSDEFKQILGYQPAGFKNNSLKIFDAAEIAESVNWLDAGAVTHVKD